MAQERTKTMILQTSGNRSYKVLLKRGIYYFITFEAARAFAEEAELGQYRLVCYGYGWAIQREKSGPYWGPNGWA